MAKQVSCQAITAAVAKMAIESNLYLPQDVKQALLEARIHEQSVLAQSILDDLLANQQVAAAENMPLCQDTGTAVVFVELGQDVVITGGLMTEAIHQGIAQGYQDGYLRKSILNDALLRENTQNNTPAVIHIDLVAGDQLKLTLAPKGGGAENMSALAMLKPAAGRQGVKEFVLKTVQEAGPNPCPPIVVGVGLGGNFEQCALLAKKALLRPLDQHHPRPDLDQLEQELLQEINFLDIGPLGFGGSCSALAVAIESAPCHIASLPVAVNINCHVARHQSITL